MTYNYNQTFYSYIRPTTLLTCVTALLNWLHRLVWLHGSNKV